MGATKVIQKNLPKIKNSKDASIVFFLTFEVQYGYNFHSQVSISKGAIEGLASLLAAAFAPLIRVNTVAPSLTNTPLLGKLLNTPEKIATQSEKTPLKRIVNTVDVAETAVCLLTPKSSWLSGQILHVDGGGSSLK